MCVDVAAQCLGSSLGHTAKSHLCVAVQCQGSNLGVGQTAKCLGHIPKSNLCVAVQC